MPDGDYNIFVVPPYSVESGFVYYKIPSMQVPRNAFLLGYAAALLTVGMWKLAVPVVKVWLATVMQSGGIGVILLVAGVGVAGWAWGKTQAEKKEDPGPEGEFPAGGGSQQYQQQQQQQQQQQHHHQQYPGAPPPNYGPPPPQSEHPPPPPPPPSDPPPEPQEMPKPEPRSPPRPNPTATEWEKAREETRRREEARKRAEELQKKRETAQKLKEEAERAAKAKAEKEKWEQARAREKEQREREARERITRERLAREKEAREKDTREREAREQAEREKVAAAATPPKPPVKATSSKYEKATARSFAGTEETHSYRPYDSPPKKNTYKSSASSVSGVSESSYAASHSTARTSPPPSMRGPYSTKDPDKIQIKAVYLFSDSFPTKPSAQLVANTGSVTDGLILHIKTEGLFIDDDVRGVPQREWDVKAWTLKLVEDGACRNARGDALHVLRATVRDADNKKYCFVLEAAEAYKVAVGLAKLKKGSQVRSLHTGTLKDADAKGLLALLGWM
nr:hypothetical protein CFP56_69155 [Quercus suber]